MSDEMGETKFLQAHSGQHQTSQPSPQDLAPYSAVSSFNLPPFCDSSLITPVSSTQSPIMATKTAPILTSDKDIKLSLSTLSPTYNFLSSADDYSSERNYNNPPMKYKHPPGTIHMSAADSSFPISPYVCPEPFWGSYNVSATSISGRSESSPSINPSPPQLHSAGGLSATSSPYSRNQTPAQSAPGYETQTQTPILIAPTPLGRRPATTPTRQNSIQPVSTAPSSAAVAQAPFPEPLDSLPPKGKKRKSPSRDREKGMVLAEAQTQEEEVLLNLSHVQRLPWKQVKRKFMERFPNSKEIGEATLQMRKKRLIDRLRMWTDEDEQALTLAVEEFDRNRWETIANSMMKYGCASKWPKELCQRKWQEIHPEDSSWLSHFDMPMRYRDSEDWGPDDGAFSDDRASACNSLQESDSGVLMSAVSTATMDEITSRATSDADSQMLHGRQRPYQQQQQMFDQQHRQHNGWGPEA